MRALKAQSRSAKVIALSMGQGLTALLGLISAMVLARLLDKVQYATFRQVFLAYALAAPFMGLGLTQGLYYFLPGEKDRVRGRVSDALTVMLLAGGVFALFLVFGGGRLLAAHFNNPALNSLLLYMAPYPLFMAPISLLSAVLVVRNRVPHLTLFNVLSRTLIGVGVILPCVVWQTASASVVGRVVTTAVVASVAVFLMFKATPAGSLKPSIRHIREMLSYCIPFGMANMIASVAVQVDKIIVSSLCSPEQFAVFVNGAFDLPLMDIITGSIGVVILADMRKMVVDNRPQDALALFRKAASQSALVLLPAMCLLFAAAEPFVTTLFSEKYVESVPIFRVYLLKLPCRVVYFSSALLVLGLSRFVLWRSILSFVLNVVLSIFLVSHVGMMGAAWGTLGTLYVAIFASLVRIGSGFQVGWWEVMPFGDLRKKFLVAVLPASAVAVYNRTFWAPLPMRGPFLLCLDIALYGSLYLLLLALTGDLRDLVQLAKRLMSRKST